MSLGPRRVCVPTVSGWSCVSRERYKGEQCKIPRDSRVLYHQKGTRTQIILKVTDRRANGSPSVSDAVDVDQDVPRAAEYLVAPVRRRVDDEPRVLHAAHELPHRDLHLQPRQRTAETEVDAV